MADSKANPNVETRAIAEKELSENLGCATFSFVIGILCLIAPLTQVTLPSETGIRKLNGWGIAGLTIGAPIVAFSMWGGVSAWLSAKAARKKRLRKTFFDLLDQQEGKLNLIAFSRAADISGNEAEAYLNERAQEFNATFEAGIDGGITYFFDLKPD